MRLSKLLKLKFSFLLCHVITDVTPNPQKARCGVNSRVNVGVNAAAALGVTSCDMAKNLTALRDWDQVKR